MSYDVFTPCFLFLLLLRRQLHDLFRLHDCVRLVIPLLKPCSTVLLEKLIVTKLVKEYSVFY